jgi:hypothetical protein
MRKYNLFVGLTAIVAMAIGTGCEGDTIEVNQETSKTELLVEKFVAAPVVDGKIDEMWGAAQKLIGTTVVPDLSARNTHLNSDGEGIEETLGLFAPYSGEEYDFTLRSGYYGDDIYLLMEWEDADDSKDRQSWYFDPADNLWKGEHKYANYEADKF